MKLAPGLTVTRGGGAGRGRPPEAAARRAGLEFVEKLLTTKLDSACSGSGDAGQVGFTGSLTVSGDA
jgi:hypothetical protein